MSLEERLVVSFDNIKEAMLYVIKNIGKNYPILWFTGKDITEDTNIIEGKIWYIEANSKIHFAYMNTVVFPQDMFYTGYALGLTSINDHTFDPNTEVFVKSIERLEKRITNTSYLIEAYSDDQDFWYKNRVVQNYQLYSYEEIYNKIIEDLLKGYNLFTLEFSFKDVVPKLIFNYDIRSIDESLHLLYAKCSIESESVPYVLNYNTLDELYKELNNIVKNSVLYFKDMIKTYIGNADIPITVEKIKLRSENTI